MSIVSIKYLRRKWNVLGIIAIVAVLLDVFGVDAMGGGPGIVCPPCYTGDECFYYICTCDSCWGCNNSTGECSVRKCNPVDCKACKMVAGNCVGCMVCGDDPNKTCCSGTPSGKCCRKPYCEECVDGNCLPCGGDPKKCCVNRVCENRCFLVNSPFCNLHNRECGCDSIGPDGCSIKRKEWSIGTQKICDSNCPPLNYETDCDVHAAEIDCYNYQECRARLPSFFYICTSGAWGYDYCQFQPIWWIFCQECEAYGTTYTQQINSHACL